jgi:hypothetical protein
MVEGQSMVAGATSAVVVSPTKVVDSSAHALQKELHWHDVPDAIAVLDYDQILEASTDLATGLLQRGHDGVDASIPLYDVYIASTEQPLGHICTHSYSLLLYGLIATKIKKHKRGEWEPEGPTLPCRSAVSCC